LFVVCPLVLPADAKEAPTMTRPMARSTGSTLEQKPFSAHAAYWGTLEMGDGGVEGTNSVYQSWALIGFVQKDKQCFSKRDTDR
jgi:hypothetical protein